MAASLSPTASPASWPPTAGGFATTGVDQTGDGTWRVGLTRATLPPAGQPAEVFEAWNGLWEGLAAMEGVRLTVVSRLDLGDPTTEWVVG